MKTVTLLHNPKAGGKEHTKEELTGLIELAGYKCLYYDVKKNGWDEIDPQTDFLAIAGGDGTIRKVVIKLIENNNLYPVALIPLGTANNISKSLNITGSPGDIINSWKKGRKIKFDMGTITGTGKPLLFLEGFGTGAFPELIRAMEKAEKTKDQTPEEEKETALKKIAEIIKSIAPVHCAIEIDGNDYSGDYILAEILNIRSIGSNLDLNPSASPSDGIMEVLLVPESQRKELIAFIKERYNRGDSLSDFEVIKCRKVKMAWKNAFAHADDKLIEINGNVKTELIVNAGLIEFILHG